MQSQKSMHLMGQQKNLSAQDQISALKSENRKLQRKLAKLEVDKSSLKSQVVALRAQVKNLTKYHNGNSLSKTLEAISKRRKIESK